MVTPSETKRLKLEVSNFGPIAEGTVELRPMTVFVGPSNTGKSYLATLIYALHQFFCAYAGTSDSRSPANLPFSMGPYPTILPARIDLSDGEMKDLYVWAEENVPKFDGERFRWVPKSSIPGSIATLLKPGFGTLTQYSKFLDNDIASCFGVNQSKHLISHHANEAEIVLLGSFPNKSETNVPFSYDVKVTNTGSSLSAEIAETMPMLIDWDNNMASVNIMKVPWHVLGYVASHGDPDDDPRNLVANVLLGNIARAVISETINPFDHSAHYLPADRAGVIQTHQSLVRSLIASASSTPMSGAVSQPTLSGVHGDFLEGLVGLGSVTAARSEIPERPLPLRMEQDILRGAIRIESNPVGYPSFFYRPKGWQRDLPLMNASAMVSELAPVVLYLRHIVHPGDTLIIEEPETNLHPQAQVDFTRVLAAAVKAGIRIIITTHSEWVLEELANLVRMSELSPERREGLEAADFALTQDEIGAWFFDSNGENGGSVVREIPLDVDSGTFPSGFGLVTADLYNRWVEITSRVENG